MREELIARLDAIASTAKSAREVAARRGDNRSALLARLVAELAEVCKSLELQCTSAD
jgi:hypothetical protein